MGTMNKFEEQLRPFKLALIGAFGLRPDQTATQISAASDTVTFRVVPSNDEDWKALQAGPLKAASLKYEAGQFPSATFHVSSWTQEQARAVEEYRAQFPSFEDLPREMREALREEFRGDRP